MLFFPLFIECYRKKIHYFFTPSVLFCFLAAKLERWRSPECRGIQALLFLSYFTKPFRNEPSAVMLSYAELCVDAAGAPWKQQPLFLCCSWSPEQPDPLVVQENAGGARLLAVLSLLPEAGSVKGRSQACPWAVCALAMWAGHTSLPVLPSALSVCSSAEGRKDDKDRGKK